MNDNKSDLALAAMAAMAGSGFGLGLPEMWSAFRPRPVRDKCTACGETIPPGKPGRKCKVCRATEATT